MESKFKDLFNNASNAPDLNINDKSFLDLLRAWDRASDFNTFLVNQIIIFISSLQAKKVDFGDWYSRTNEYNKKIVDMAMEIQNTMNESKSEDYECKPPLKSGELTFNDIAGQDSVKDDLIVQYINPFTYPKLFPKKASGVLFYGVGGTGKTMLARASTAEIGNAAFFAPSPGDLRGKYEGETEKNIDKVFKCAEQELIKQPNYDLAIIFFDEFDSLAGKRGDDPGMTRSVNTLLQAMDGITSSNNVSVIAATNFPNNIDDAILRRFTTRIFIDLPDPAAREYLIRDGLAKVYSNPLMIKDKEYKKLIYESLWVDGNKDNGYDQNADYLTNIEKYGEVEIVPGGFVSKETSIKKYITNEYILELIDKLGPTQEGKNMMENPDNFDIDSKALDSDEHIFGYSPSDISKIIDMAVKRAAARALGDPITKVIFTYKNNKEWFWVTNPKIEDEDVEVAADLTSPEDKTKVINFNILQEDMELAIKSYASTVDNHSYFELLKYSRYN